MCVGVLVRGEFRKRARVSIVFPRFSENVLCVHHVFFSFAFPLEGRSFVLCVADVK